jgi:DNA-binding transcriptional LysR family regulator
MAIHFDLTDLRLFVYIAEENSLTRAAVRAHMSLPAASIRIKNLEESIGARLINRDSQGITLRPPGLTLLHHARSLNLKILRLNDDWAARNLIICVRDLDALPGFARELVNLLIADGNLQHGCG